MVRRVRSERGGWRRGGGCCRRRRRGRFPSGCWIKGPGIHLDLLVCLTFVTDF